MAKNNFTEQDLKNKGLVETSPGKWEHAHTVQARVYRKSTQSDAATAGIKIHEKVEAILARPLTDSECIKILTEGGSLEESGSFNHAKNVINDFKQNGIMFFDENDISYTRIIVDAFWYKTQTTLKAYEFNITPNTKPRQTISDKWNKRKCVMQYRAFADTLRSQASMLNFELKSPLIVEFYVPMATSWGKKKRTEMEGKPHTQTPDCDNFCKALQDALLGQDNLISEIHARKLWSTNGRIIIYA